MMGFYFKVAPGVKIRATSRGVRASMGPRAARVHFGAGGTGFSTGAGPVSVYEAASGGRSRRSGAGPSRTAIAAHERQVRQAQKAQQATDLRTAFAAIDNVHRQEFTLAAAPVAPPPAPVNEAAIRQWYAQQACRGLSLLQRSARASARKQAAEMAERVISASVTRALSEQRQLQLRLDERWRRLLTNDPGVVSAALAEAFEHGEISAAVAGVDAAEASVVMLVPGIEAIPERMPKLTPAGNLSMPKLTKGVRNSYYLRLVCGHVLVTVRAALSAAPALEAVRVAVVRQSAGDAYGIGAADCLVAALFSRQRLHSVRWESADSDRIVRDASTELLMRQSATQELLPLDLAKEPGLAALLDLIGNEEVAGDSAGAPPSASPLGGVASGALAGAAASGPSGGAPSSPAGATASGPAGGMDRRLSGPPPSGSGRKRNRKRPARIAGLVTSAFAVFLIIVIIAANGGKAKTDGNVSTTATSKPTPTATSMQPTAQPVEQPATSPRKHPKKALIPHQATTPTPTVSAPAVAPPTPTPVTSAPAPVQTTPTGCYPMSDEGTCYEPGEFCRDDDHGVSGVAGDGEAIICEDNDGWRWEPV